MRRGAVAIIVCALMAVPALAHAEQGDPPCPPGQAPDPSGLVCVFVDKTTTGIDAATQPAAQDPWLTRALELQHRLGDALPLRDAMWVGTHNSFNTISNRPPSLSNTDSNQHVSLVDQLRLGVRGIEIDIHWMPSVWAGGANAVVVCHGRPESELNAGCTDERLLFDELAPIGAWLRQPENRSDVILVYIEDDLDSAAGYAAAASAINETIGDLVYKPPTSESCPLLPLALRRADVLAAGKQVVVMSGCGTGDTGAWGSTVFNDSVRSEEGNPEFAGYPACTSPSVVIGDYGTKLVRFYEDSTFVTTAHDGHGDPGHRLTVDGIRDMVRCGVNLFGLDQVDPSDPRLEAMVWSWAANEPVTSAAGMCAVDGSDGRFHAGPCGGAQLRFACVDSSTGAWFVSEGSGTGLDGSTTCELERPRSVFAVPGNGNHAQLLIDAKTAAGVSHVWVAYSVVDGDWKGLAA